MRSDLGQRKAQTGFLLVAETLGSWVALWQGGTASEGDSNGEKSKEKGENGRDSSRHVLGIHHLNVWKLTDLGKCFAALREVLSTSLLQIQASFENTGWKRSFIQE